MFQDHFCFSISYQPSRISSLVRSVRRKPPPKEKFNWSLNTEKLHLCVARILISMFIAMTWHRSMTLRLLGSIAMRKSELKARRGKISFVEVIWLLVASSAISDFNTWFSIHRSSVYSSEPTYVETLKGETSHFIVSVSSSANFLELLRFQAHAAVTFVDFLKLKSPGDMKILNRFSPLMAQ